MEAEAITEDVQRRCVFCRENDHFRDEQILVRDSSFYLCAPLGQLVEGYLVIAPYGCGTSLSQLPADRFAELDAMVAIVEDFYRLEYACADAIYYEQGRAGGGARVDPDGAFPLHAHLCGLPVACDLHGLLGGRYARVDVGALSDLRAAAAGQPYVYASAGGRQAVYLGRTKEQREELERFRLTPQLAALLGIADQGDWRQYPGRDKLDSLLRRFGRYRSRTGF